MKKVIKKVNFVIFDEKWTVELLEYTHFEKLHGKDVHGVTIPEKRMIHLTPPLLTVETVAHELTHAYVKYVGGAALQLKRWQIEELACELVAEYSERIRRLARELSRKLRK